MINVATQANNIVSSILGDESGFREFGPFVFATDNWGDLTFIGNLNTWQLILIQECDAYQWE